MKDLKLLEVVALTRDLPDHDLCIGEVGTIVEVYDGTAFEVEFVEDSGYTKALLTVSTEDLRKLRPDEMRSLRAATAEK